MSSSISKLGANIHYNDNYIESINISKDFNFSITDSLSFGFDCVVIVTNHSYYDIPTIVNDVNWLLILEMQQSLSLI